MMRSVRFVNLIDVVDLYLSQMGGGGYAVASEEL